MGPSAARDPSAASVGSGVVRLAKRAFSSSSVWEVESSSVATFSLVEVKMSISGSIPPMPPMPEV